MYWWFKTDSRRHSKLSAELIIRRARRSRIVGSISRKTKFSLIRSWHRETSWRWENTEERTSVSIANSSIFITSGTVKSKVDKYKPLRLRDWYKHHGRKASGSPGIGKNNLFVISLIRRSWISIIYIWNDGYNLRFYLANNSTQSWSYPMQSLTTTTSPLLENDLEVEVNTFEKNLCKLRNNRDHLSNSTMWKTTSSRSKFSIRRHRRYRQFY